MAYYVHLKDFDGPLDLLLTLISRAKVNIQDVFVSEITKQYLESMSGIDELDMDTASEFLAMAAMLIEIKSRALLPREPKPEPDEEESPEAMLIRRLEEYQRFKETAENMKALEASASRVFFKLPEEYPLPPPKTLLHGLTLEGLARAFAEVLSRAVQEEAFVAQRQVQREVYTVSGCMFDVQARLREGKPLPFSRLFSQQPSREEIVSYFMAILELLRLGRLRLHQEALYEEIILSAV